MCNDAGLDQVHGAIDGCTKCAPFAGPTYAKIIGLRRGSLAPIVVIGQGPAAKESAEKRAFAGAAGTVLDRWLVASGADPTNPRERVYLTSLLKCGCRAAGHVYWRMVENCEPFLVRQISVIRPSLVITLGKAAYDWIREDARPYASAACSRFTVGDNPLLSRFPFGIDVLAWPHPSPANNAMLRRSDIRQRMVESFAVVRQHLH